MRDEATHLQDLIDAMPTDPDGIMHFGTDGVLRSLSATKEVIGFVQLSPSELASYAENQLHPSSEKKRNPELLAWHLQETWGDVDGRDVTRLEELLNPRGMAITPWHPSGGVDPRSPCNDCGKTCARDRLEERAANGSSSKNLEGRQTSRIRNRSPDGLFARSEKVAVCFTSGSFCYSNKECPGTRRCKCVWSKCNDGGSCKTV